MSKGFKWLENKKDYDKLIKKADKNGDDVVDFDEFIQAAAPSQDLGPDQIPHVEELFAKLKNQIRIQCVDYKNHA